MKLYVGVTDDSWFHYLAREKPEEINFWQPGGKQVFKAIPTNGLFLFKLHSPNNFIAGGGVFVQHSFLPVSLAWEAFGDKNGTKDFVSFRNAIVKYRKKDYREESDPTIGCIILSQPFFFEKKDWIPVPQDWSPSIMQGKTYDTETETGRYLYEQVQTRLTRQGVFGEGVVQEVTAGSRYGNPQIILPRIGQSTFKVMVTEAYHRRCAVTGEKTLPVLEAAHILPFSQSGPHHTTNGLLLRKDVHALFDRGYITINPDLQIEVSKRIKEDYGNGREYYAMHGKKLVEVPTNVQDRPATQFLQWHNEKVYLA